MNNSGISVTITELDGKSIRISKLNDFGLTLVLTGPNNFEYVMDVDAKSFKKAIDILAYS